MSDVRRMDVWNNKYLPEIGDGSFVSDSSYGTHALLTWEEYQNTLAMCEQMESEIEELRKVVEAAVKYMAKTDEVEATPCEKTAHARDLAFEDLCDAICELEDSYE